MEWQKDLQSQDAQITNVADNSFRLIVIQDIQYLQRWNDRNQKAIIFLFGTQVAVFVSLLMSLFINK